MNNKYKKTLDLCAIIADCENCEHFYTCDNNYHDNNIFKCAINSILDKMMYNNG